MLLSLFKTACSSLWLEQTENVNLIITSWSMSRPKTRYVLGQLHNHLNALIACVEVILNVVIGDPIVVYSREEIEGSFSADICACVLGSWGRGFAWDQTSILRLSYPWRYRDLLTHISLPQNGNQIKHGVW
jgi:hypothetical protein